VPSRVNFFEFLQERWPIFLERWLPSGLEGHHGNPGPYDLRQPGPADLPFEHEDVRVYMDNLFTDGLLTPTSGISRSALQGTWMAVGVAGAPTEGQAERLRKLLELHEAEEPDSSSDHHEWIKAAVRWAEIVAVRWAISDVLEARDVGRFDSAHVRVQEHFRLWLASHYASLHSLSFLPRPVMPHQVPRYLAHRAMSGGGGRKSAVLVVDGLAMDQWAVLRQQMQVGRSWVSDNSGLFALIPTLTSVSRQSIFAGDPPFFFATSLETTKKEEQHWTRFWENRGVCRDAVAYVCQGTQESDQSIIARVRERIDRAHCSVLGIVIGTVDQMLHGVVTGTDGFHASIRHWGQRGALRDLIDILLAKDFEVVLTSDHGNVEGIGIGKPNVGVTAEQRGQRVHVFRDSNLRARISASYPGSIEWPSIGLPEDYLALIAPAQRAFITQGRQTLAHGGICIEEVIVRFVSITRHS
jgi:PglZ domain